MRGTLPLLGPLEHKQEINKLRGLSPRANYNDSKFLTLITETVIWDVIAFEVSMIYV
jgi:hypothetical protein